MRGESNLWGTSGASLGRRRHDENFFPDSDRVVLAIVVDIRKCKGRAIMDVTEVDAEANVHGIC